ncbi:MAG: flagellar hook-associated protein FlgL [Acidimicrobiales bacterium]
MSDITRVTQQSASMLMVADLESSLSNLTELQQEAASGKSLNQPSDNPVGTAEVLSLNAQIGRFQQYSANISDGQSWLNTADSTLGSVIKALDQVQTDVLSGANASSQDSTSLQALSQQVLATKQQVIGLANTTYNNRYIFSGTYGISPYPQATAGVSSSPDIAYKYAGNDQPVTRVVAPGETTDVSVTGDQVFGSGSNSVFALLDTISQDLASGNTSQLSGADLTQLQSAIAKVTTAQGDVGALGAGLANAATNATNTVQSLQTQVANITDANEAQVATELDLAETSYQAALETTAKIIQPSLVDFLQ